MGSHVLNLLTINTWKCDGSYRERLSLLKHELKQLQPDIVFCQEVFRTTTADTGRELAESLNMTYQFTPARYKTRIFEGEMMKSYSGLGLITRYPILKTEILVLPTDPRDGERMAQCCLVDCEGTPVLAINTHLTHLRNSSPLRIQQLDTILGLPLLTQHKGPVFIAGDFNADPESDELQFLLNHPVLSIQDAYLSGQGPEPGFTMLPQAPHQPAKGRRIDFIFSVATTPEQHPVFANARVVLNQPNADGVYPSDHCGVMIQTHLTHP